MTFNLIALAVFLATLAAGVALLWRRLPGAAAAAAGEAACAACGTPGRLLAADSFVCPACRRDVRDLGVARARPGAAAGPLWRAVGFSAVLCAVAVGGTALWIEVLPRVEHVSAAANTWQSGKAYRLVEFAVNGQRVGRGAGRGPLEGELTADLFLMNGEVVTLEVQSPSLRYRVIDTAGREAVPPSAEGAFDESAVLRWTEAAGLDPADRDVRALARAAYTKSYELLGRQLPPVAPLPPVTERGSFATGSGSSSSGSSGPPAYALPAAVIFWSLLWLAGLWLIVPRGNREPSPAPPPEGVPA